MHSGPDGTRRRRVPVAILAAVAAVTFAAAGAVPLLAPAAGPRRTPREALTRAAVVMVQAVRQPRTPLAPPPAALTTGPGGPVAAAAAAAPAVPAGAPAVTPPSAPARPTPTTVPTPAVDVPPVGQATAWGCAAALAYLDAYAAKGFVFVCPGYADGHDAMTCVTELGTCPSAKVIAIADACPQAYMNEASNSWVLTGQSDSPIDPYGPCP